MVSKSLLAALASSLLDDVQRNAQADWCWFEAGLTYDNGRLPQALLIAGHLLSNRQCLTVAQELLDFLLAQVVEDGVVVPIGQAGWYWRGKPKARYDQQPIDAASLVEVCTTASIILGEPRYWDIALAAWAWFNGRNSEGLVLYDAQTSGCHDGLECGSVNDNQGAESTLALLQAALALNDPNWLGVTEERLAKASTGSRKLGVNSMELHALRIAMLGPIAWRTPPRHYGAWETVVHNLTEGLVARGCQVTLFATADSVTSAELVAVCPRPIRGRSSA